MRNYKELLQHINTFIFDYDGVLTDGSVITTNEGDAYRVSNVKDGYALQLAVKKGYRVAVISGARSDSMMHRLKALQITDIFRAKIVDVQSQSLTIEVTGDESKVEKIISLMKPFGIIELTRTGKVALPRD